MTSYWKWCRLIAVGCIAPSMLLYLSNPCAFFFSPPTSYHIPFFFLVLSVHSVVCGWRGAVFRRRQCDGRTRRHAICNLQHHAILLALGATRQTSLCWPQVHVGELQTWVKTQLVERACLLQAFSIVFSLRPQFMLCVVLVHCTALWPSLLHNAMTWKWKAVLSLYTISVTLRSLVHSRMSSNSLLTQHSLVRTYLLYIQYLYFHLAFFSSYFICVEESKVVPSSPSLTSQRRGTKRIPPSGEKSVLGMGRREDGMECVHHIF